MNFGLIIIGDEILSGKRADKHMPKVIELLKARGLKLAFAEYLGDDRARIVDTYRRTFALAAGGDWCVFSCGGIGATPDDHTRQAAAAALGVPLALHPLAEREIRARAVEMNWELTAQRLAMGEFPAGSEIIPNPYNRIPGFAVGRHWFVPGFPVMAWPMVEWVLDTHYREHFDHAPYLEKSIFVFDLGESQLIDMMVEAEKDPAIKTFSLPSVGDAKTPRHIELGAKGEPHAVTAALARFGAAVDALGGTWSETLR
ncbi:MAG: competence/damage-inducible protein A [Burkholderiales bacterium]|nr:competence/damage-inducible protein A [Burkholderiales bacterium]